MEVEEFGPGTFPLAEYDRQGVLHVFANGLRRYTYLYYREEPDGTLEMVGSLVGDRQRDNAVPLPSYRPRLAVSPSGKAAFRVAPVANIYDPERRDVRPEQAFAFTVSGPGAVTLPNGETCGSGETCEFRLPQATIGRIWLEPEAAWAETNFTIQQPNLGVNTRLTFMAPNVDYRYYMVGAPDVVWEYDTEVPIELGITFE